MVPGNNQNTEWSSELVTTRRDCNVKYSISRWQTINDIH